MIADNIPGCARVSPRQPPFNAVGDGVADDTAAIQSALNYLASVGGGVLEWCNSRVSGVLTIQGSNITIRPGVGNKIVQAGASYNTFRVYSASLNSIWSGAGRPVGFENGVDGAPELLMYESSDALRLRNIQILDLEFSYTGGGAGGRFIDAFSVDHMVVRGCKAVSSSNAVTLWYCRDAEVKHNDLTSSTATFPLFFFKSHGEVAYNSLRDGFNGFDAKGCYPQPGKTTLQAFDAGYEFWHPVKVHHNRFYNINSCACQVGYFDNAAGDISSGAPVGVTKSQWYGEMWGAEVCDNTVFQPTATLGIQSGGLRMNVNTRFAKYNRNTLYGGGFTAFGASDGEFCDNTIINARMTATAAIEVTAFTTGAVSRNSQRLTVARNRVVGHARQAIYVRGADDCDVEDNKISGGAAGFDQILVDSTNSASTSTANHILNNRIRGTATDFAYGVKSTGAARTVIDGNRAYGGYYSGNALDSDGFSDAHFKRGVVCADTPFASVGTPGTCYVGQNFGDQNATTPVAGYASGMAVNGPVGGGWRQPMILGVSFYWTTAAGVYRTKLISAGKPTLDTDGTVVGTQT